MSPATRAHRTTPPPEPPEGGARLDHRESLMRASSAGNPSELLASVAFGVAARIVRGQA